MNLKTLSYPTKEITFNPNIFSRCTQLTTLIITGEGDIPNYEQDKQLWYSIRGRISTITLNENIETIGNYAFEGTSIQTINLQSVETIGENVFSNTQLKYQQQFQ